MLDILKHRTYRHLFFAQVVALLGTGLATVALSLMAFDLAGNEAGQILGTAMAIKMTAYVLIAPLASAFAESVSRRMLLVSLDVVRAFRYRNLGGVCANRRTPIRLCRVHAHISVHHSGYASG